MADPVGGGISIVMPTLDQAAFIGQAIDSVWAQAVPGLELVVCDGGSSDGTLDLLASLQATHGRRLRWVSAADGGPADAVNRAVALAQGALIGWLNSDDLYAPGAVARALVAFERDPALVMVYGEGEHIDAAGAVLGRYPTLPPDAPLAAWADGCPVCQPTVFFRRETFGALGGLDTALRTAFDYEFWLRVFKAHPGAVGFVPAVQARSRLHSGAITLRLREAVALEALQLIHRHIGPAPAHWLLTHFDEVMAGLPFDGSAEAPTARLLRLVGRAEPWLSAAAAASLRAHVSGHRALQLATADFFAPVHADGWAPPVLELRLRQPTPAFAALRLHGRHASPVGGALRLRACAPGGGETSWLVPAAGPFEITLPLQGFPPGAEVRWTLHCLDPFVPAGAEAGSTDRRALAFLLEGAQPWPSR